MNFDFEIFRVDLYFCDCFFFFIFSKKACADDDLMRIDGNKITKNLFHLVSGSRFLGLFEMEILSYRRIRWLI